MDGDTMTKMGLTAGVAEMALDESVRVRGEGLSLTLLQIRQLRGVLFTLESTAEAQMRDLEVALHKMNKGK